MAAMTNHKGPGGALQAVIFDRDGVLNRDLGYVGDPARLEWMPGAMAAVARLNRAAILALVATNQSGVARGYFAIEAVEAVHAAMQADLAAIGARIDRFYVCPFHAEAAEARWRHPDHPDRKPNPGMILAAMSDFTLDPSRVALIGDADRDLEAARRAGISGHRYDGGDLDVLVERLVAGACAAA